MAHIEISKPLISVSFGGLLLGVCGLMVSRFTGAGDRLIGVTDLCDKPPGVRLNREVVSLCHCWFCTNAIDPFHYRSAAFRFARNSVT